MEAYRDPLATAKERIAALEAEARERGLPLGSRRKLERLALPAVAAGILFGLIGLRSCYDDLTQAAPRHRTYRPLAWFEPAIESEKQHPGPIAVTVGGRPRLVGLLWRRDEHADGLRVVMFDRATLKSEWVSPRIPSEWSSADSDRRYRLSVMGDLARVHAAEGAEYSFDLSTLRASESSRFDLKPISTAPIPPDEAPVAGERFTVTPDHSIRLADGRTLSIPNRDPSARVRFVSRDADLRFVLVDDELHVYDAATGAHRAILDAP